MLEDKHKKCSSCGRILLASMDTKKSHYTSYVTGGKRYYNVWCKDCHKVYKANRKSDSSNRLKAIRKYYKTIMNYYNVTGGCTRSVSNCDETGTNYDIIDYSNSKNEHKKRSSVGSTRPY